MFNLVFYLMIATTIISFNMLQSKNITNAEVATIVVDIVKKEKKETFLERLWPNLLVQQNKSFSQEENLSSKRSRDILIETFLKEIWSPLIESNEIKFETKEDALITTVELLKQELECSVKLSSKKEVVLNKAELDRIFNLNNSLMQKISSSIIDSFNKSIILYNKNLNEYKADTNYINTMFSILEREAKNILKNKEDIAVNRDVEEVSTSISESLILKLETQVKSIFPTAQKPEYLKQMSALTTDFLDQIKSGYKATKTIPFFGGTISNILKDVETKLISKISVTSPNSPIINFLKILSVVRSDSSKKADDIENAFNSAVNKHVGTLELKTAFISELLENVT